MNVVYSPRAMRDLQDISAYLVERNPAGAANVLRAIKSSVETLSFFPQIGRVVDDAGHRRLPVLRYPYLIYISSTIALPVMSFSYFTSDMLRVVRSTHRPTFDLPVVGPDA